MNCIVVKTIPAESFSGKRSQVHWPCWTNRMPKSSSSLIKKRVLVSASVGGYAAEAPFENHAMRGCRPPQADTAFLSTPVSAHLGPRFLDRRHFPRRHFYVDRGGAKG